MYASIEYEHFFELTGEFIGLIDEQMISSSDITSNEDLSLLFEDKTSRIVTNEIEIDDRF